MHAEPPLVFVLSPPGTTDPAFAAAATAAGARGVFDLTWLEPPGREQALERLRTAPAPVYVRLDASPPHVSPSTSFLPDPLLTLSTVAGFFVTAGPLMPERRAGLEATVHRLKAAGREVWLEVRLVEDLTWARGLPVDGLVLAGAEGGGWCAAETSLVLLQRALESPPRALESPSGAHSGLTTGGPAEASQDRSTLPLLVQGGVGPTAVPALLEAGAAGVVIDATAWLLPGSPLSPAARGLIGGLEETDTATVGRRLPAPCRLLARVASRHVRALVREEEQRPDQEGAGWAAELEHRIRRSVQGALESDRPLDQLIPIGQDGAFAADVARAYADLPAMMAGLREAVRRTRAHLEAGDHLLSARNPLPGWHGVPTPFVMGPMAQVSECPPFLEAIGRSGALPFISLGNTRRERAAALLTAIRALRGGAPWGAGIIGLPTNQEAWEAHLELFDTLRPPFVTVAAGSLEQAIRLRAAGHRVYLHTPSRGTLRSALEEARADQPMGVILEGTECGGHIGTISSLVLWQAGVEEIGRWIDRGGAPEAVSLLLAGGIASPVAVAFAAALTAPLVARGVKVGLQLGSGYLMTREAIETGAVTPEYQRLITRARGTTVMGETLGLRVRCLPTPAAADIVRREYARAASSEPLYDRKHAYEQENLGGLRLAAKGVVREAGGAGGQDREASSAERIERGLYHVGQVAALLEAVRPAGEMHGELREGALMRLGLSEERLEAPAQPDDCADAVAIIGLGAVLPGGPDVASFWRFVLEGRDCIREVPAERWRKEDHFSADRAAPDRTYSAIGAFVEGFTFDSLRFRVLPRVAKALDETQKWALHATAAALSDAGYGPGGREVPGDRCAVILANPMGGEQHYATSHRVLLGNLGRYVDGLPELEGIPSDRRRAIGEALLAAMRADLPEVNEDSMPGELSNVTAGRIASVFNLRGPNYTVDAACASSLAAMADAVEGLRRGDFDLAISGGTDRTMGPSTYVKFSKIGALSATGSRPFDADADGFVMGEGCAIFVLKRLADARRDGDRVYAVVRGVGASSDGKGKGITAPNPVGQKLALERAYRAAGIDPGSVGLIEAHGTSTPVGDATEVGVLAEFFHGAAKGSIALGSVKSQVGHLKGAAGAVSMLKATLALHHRILPPSANVKHLNPAISWDTTPFEVPRQARPWPRPAHGRWIAGVSAFGFGGTNFHLVLEGASAEAPTAARETGSGVGEPQTPPGSRGGEALSAKTETHGIDPRPTPAPGMNGLMEGVFTLGASDRPALRTGLERLRDTMRSGGAALEALASPSRLAGHPVRLTITYGTRGELEKKIDQVLGALATGRPELWTMLANQGVALGEGEARPVAFLFPGQGSQSINMLSALRERFPVVATTFAEADEAMAPVLGGRLTDLVFVPADADAETLARANARLSHTTITQPAILAADIAIHRLLEQHGIRPDAVLGHSLGEYAALVAAGGISFAAAMRAVSARGHAMADLSIEDPGRMASVAAPWEQVVELLREIDGYVVPANKNSPRQTVIAGATAAVEQAIELLKASSIHVTPLNVSHAFHSRIVAPASEPLRRVLEGLELRPPRLPILSNVNAGPYPATVGEMVEMLSRQVAAPVEFVACIERLYDLGIRVFVECGPRAVLTRFVQDVLGERKDVTVIATNVPKRGDLESLRDAVAALWATGAGLPAPAIVVVPQSQATPERHEAQHAAAAYEAVTHTLVAATFSVADSAHPGKETAGAVDPALSEELTVRHDSSGPLPSFTEFLSWQRDTLERFLDRSFQQYRAVAGERQPAAAPTPSPASVKADGVARMPSPSVEPPTAPVATVEVATGAAAPVEAAPVEATPGEAPVVISGASIGFPGRERRVFDDGNLERLFEGQSFLDPVPDAMRKRMLELNIVRLVKERDQDPRFERLDRDEEVIHLAGQRGRLDLVQDYGLSPEVVATLDVTSSLAVAAALEALRDAHIPLVRRYRETSTGVRLPDRWVLPPGLADETGVIFASAFPGYNQLLDQVKQAGSAEFDRKFLFEVLAFGHAQVAEMLGIRGPNTQLNAACASTTQAIGVAEDWIRSGRCRRVLVLGADDVTSEAMLPWIGAGFLASGAATPASRIEDAALPFDRRRHGMLIGMGAVGLVVEEARCAADRGVAPLAEILSTTLANSAYHGSRLDGAHLSGVMEQLVATAERRAGVGRLEMSRETLFMSHETFTPARGGSASAEVAALRRVFGEAAAGIPIANTKGFTGHPMAAGLEDGVLVKCLQYGRVPPIANLRDPDPELMPLNLSSQPRRMPLRYGIRLAAGFGSQVAMVLLRRVADGDRRVTRPEVFDGWMRRMSGQAAPRLELVHRTLRVAEGPAIEVGATQAAGAARMEGSPPAGAMARPAGVARVDETGLRPSSQEVQDGILATVAEKTGYPTDLLELDLDLEADLGIDTIKQAEVFAALRERFRIPKQETLKLRDYPTLRHLMRFVEGQLEARGVQEQQTATAAPASIPDAGETSLAEAAELPRPPAPPTEFRGEGVTVRRRVVDAAWRAPLLDFPETGVRLEAGVRVLVAGDPEGGAALEAALAGRGVEVVRSAALPVEEAAIEAWVRSIGDVTGVFWVSHLETTADERFPDTATWDELVCRHLEHPWLVAKALGSMLNQPGRFFIAATRLGGTPGLPLDSSQQPASPIDGLTAGLCKALAREWPACLVKAVDLAVAAPAGLLAATLIGEALADPAVVEVGHRGGSRWVPRLVERPVDPTVPSHSWSPQTVYLCAGGAQGITAELIEAMAATHPGRYILTGRTGLPPEIDPEMPQEVQATRRWIADRLKAAGMRATPVEVEEAIGRMQRGARIRRLIETLRSHGCHAEYHAVDVADADAVQRLVDDVVSRFGGIDVIIHAAGVEISRRIADKPLEEVRRVLQPKVVGWGNLVRATERLPLRALVTFSSVAARFGNPGQTDYAAANDLLNHGARWLSARRPGMKAVSIDWTAWDEVGMAARGAILEHLRQAGVTALPVALGRPLLAAELDHVESATEVVIDCGLGALEAPVRSAATEAEDPSRRTLDRLAGWLKARPGSLPLLGTVTTLSPEGVFEIERTLDPDRDRFLKDHAIGGVPVLPGVIGLELFAEAARLVLGPALRVHGFKEVRFLRALKVHEGRTVTAHIRIEPIPRSRPDQVAARCELVSWPPMRGRGGEPGKGPGAGAVEPRVHFQATVVLGPPADHAPVEPMALPEGEAPPATPEAIYQALFHGPAFQVCGGAVAGESASWAEASRRREPILPNELEGALSAHPMEVELAFQTAGLWELSEGGRMGLPAEIRRLEVLRPDAEEAGASGAVARAVPGADGGTTFQIEVLAADGGPLLKLEGYGTVDTDAAVPGAGLWELRRALRRREKRVAGQEPPASSRKEES